MTFIQVHYFNIGKEQILIFALREIWGRNALALLFCATRMAKEPASLDVAIQLEVHKSYEMVNEKLLKLD